jgi:enoyl-CoA hydratase
MADLLSLKKEGMVGVITLENPKKLNAISAKLVLEMNAAIHEIEYDDDLRVAVITGNPSGIAFCAGYNLEEVGSVKKGKEFYAPVRNLHKLFLEMEGMGKPIIAAVNGLALGGGCELAMACDIRIAAEAAVFGLPEILLGLLPAAGGMSRLPRLVSLGVAKEMIFTGRNVKSDEALRIGLVNKVVPNDQLMKEAMALAQVIAEKPPISIATGKTTVNRNMETDQYSATMNESAAICKVLDTEDAKEGLASFIEKRKPAPYKGR